MPLWQQSVNVEGAGGEGRAPGRRRAMCACVARACMRVWMRVRVCVHRRACASGGGGLHAAARPKVAAPVPLASGYSSHLR